LIFMSLLSE